MDKHCYLIGRGGQSTYGSRSRAACITSSSSITDDFRCSAKVAAALIHSVNGGLDSDNLKKYEIIVNKIMTKHKISLLIHAPSAVNRIRLQFLCVHFRVACKAANTESGRCREAQVDKMKSDSYRHAHNTRGQSKHTAS